MLKSEIKHFIDTRIFYAFLAVFIALSAFFFFANAALTQYIFNTLPLILVFLIPILTANSLKLQSDERSSALRVVLAKFLAVMVVYVIALATTIAYPIIMYAPFRTLFWGSLAPIYVGFLFYGAAMSAIGILISTVAKNSAVAAMVSFGVMFILNFVDMLGLWSGNMTFARVVNFISFSNRIFDVNLISMLYFTLIATLFTLLTIHKLNRRR